MALPSSPIRHPSFQSDKAQESTVLSVVNAANYKGHKLQPTLAAQQVKNALPEGNCSICTDKYRDFEIKKLSLLSCFHVFHPEPCLSRSLNEKSSCPVCRAPVDNSNIKVFENSTELEKALPMECTQNLCTAEGDETTINSGAMSQCPYPLAMFPHKSAESFLEKNNSAIIDWLRASFKQKQYSIRELKYTEHYVNPDIPPHLNNQPAIAVDIQNPERSLYYSSVDINKAESPEAAFTNLLEDLRTDLLILRLRKTHPAIFNGGTELFIRHYDLWNHNAIFINNMNNVIPLRTVFDPSTKSFSWEKLKQELEKKGFEYEKLFDNSLASCTFAGMSRGQICGPDVDDYSSSRQYRTAVDSGDTPPLPQPVNRVEIPSGELDTNFLF